MKISDRVILPLVGSAFQPGKAAEAIEKIEDKELAQIVHLRILHLEIHRQHSVQGKMYISV